MRLYDIPIAQITLEILGRLKEDEVIEDKQLDYKEDFPQKKDKDGRREFLSDITAMVNTMGGDILVGIKERRDSEGRPTGIPEQIVGIQIANWDALRRDWEQLITDTIEPRIQGLEIEPIYIATDRAVIVFRIPPSLQSPHMVTSRPCFYFRSAGRSSPMDIDTIRHAFLRSASLRERAESFCRNRIHDVLAGLSPVTLTEGAKIFLHIIPLGTQPFSINLGDQRVREKTQPLFPLDGRGYDYNRLNFDGLLNFSTSRREQGTSDSYVQIFRDGSIEFCDARLLKPYPKNRVEVHAIPAERFEFRIIASLNSSLRLFEQLNISLPIVVFLSLTEVKGYFVDDDRTFHDEVFLIERDSLFLPGQLIERREQKADHILNPIFDAIWNASGLPKSRFYDENGDWKGRQF